MRVSVSVSSAAMFVPGSLGFPGEVHVVFPSRRGLVPAVRALIDALAEGFADGANRPSPC